MRKPASTQLARLFAAAAIAIAVPAEAQISINQGAAHDVHVHEYDNGVIMGMDATGVYAFRSWNEYLGSDFFLRNNKRCGTVEDLFLGAGSPSDCSNSFTNPAPEYDPSVARYRIPVVFHVLQHPNGSGFVPDSAIQSQIDILNQDFLALSGSLGGNGTNTEIEFFLADVDPSGNPSSGITRHANSQWYNDKGNYASAVGWDTTRYLNIYTNTAGGNLGYAYVPNGGGVVGNSFDGVRILWTTVGFNAPAGPPYNLGRTTTHEVGHYLGLYHTFTGGCASASGCASNGDLICDTNPEAGPNYSPCSRTTCGSPDPTDNYMDYSDDICMQQFTPDQARRMRCTLENFRAGLLSDPPPPNDAPSVNITAPSNGASFDEGTSIGFSGTASDTEDGNLSSSIGWSSNLDGSLGSGASIGAVLSVGSHVVTATVTDSGGSSDSASISVTVNGTPGGGLSLSGNGYKVKGVLTADLSWSNASGANVDVYRDGSYLTTTANDGAYTDSTGVKGGASFTYQVCEEGSSNCSNTITLNW